MSPPLAYFITFTTYGTWLHGREPGSVDREHNVPGTPFLAPDRQLETRRRNALRQEPYTLDQPRREVVLRTVREVCSHRSWTLHAVHVRPTHVHVVVAAPAPPEKVMADLKAWASRRLREAFGEDADRDRWTQHGSTRYLNGATSLEAVVAYVVDEQGEPMSVFDSRNANHEPENEPKNEPEA
ncbi:MAG: transposase [Gemmataceae bacterium]|nr:transposase [Gemmataceae bacterium]